MMKERILKVGLLGPFGGGNLGDSATVDAVIQNIRRYYPNVLIYGFSENPDDTQSRHGIPSFRIGRGWREDDNLRNRLSKIVGNWLLAQPFTPLHKLERWVRRAPIEFDLLMEAYQNLGNLNSLIICGGGQLLDYWGGPFSQPYTLFRFAMLSRLRNVNYIFLNVGAGPIKHWLSKLLIRLSLSSACYRSYRDEYSKDYVFRVLGYKRNDPVYPDLAFSLEIPKAQIDLVDPNETHHRPVVAIGPMAYFDPRVWPEKDEKVYANYLKKLADFAEWLLMSGRSIRFITGESLHDREVVKDLNQLLEARGLTGVDGRIKQEPIYTTKELIFQIASSDFVVASRFHNVILSQMLNRPIIALSYHSKVQVLMEDMDLSFYCLQLNHFEVEELVKRYLVMEADCEKIKQQLANKVMGYRNLLDQQYQHIGKEV